MCFKFVSRSIGESADKSNEKKNQIIIKRIQKLQNHDKDILPIAVKISGR